MLARCSERANTNRSEQSERRNNTGQLNRNIERSDMWRASAQARAVNSERSEHERSTYDTIKRASLRSIECNESWARVAKQIELQPKAQGAQKPKANQFPFSPKPKPSFSQPRSKASYGAKLHTGPKGPYIKRSFSNKKYPAVADIYCKEGPN